ncbi:hypothetical protein J4E91_002307 [Alternaria rosae]|nr:hypothetical protein J4E91_002307 [Alternaria rosae]
MKTLSSLFIAIIAIALAVYNNEYMLSRLTQSLKHVTSLAKTTKPFYNATEDMSTMFRGLPVIPDEKFTTDAPRKIAKSFLAVEQSEGAGAKVRRSVGTPKLRNFSPFLMLDHFAIPPGAGFPDHPHRGQETITYLLSGAVDHEDFAGNKGTIEQGDLQFMTAGRGIVHAEMPRQNEDGAPNVGMQLWVDLPKELKSCEPRYRDLRAKEIPETTADNGKVHVKVISGQAYGTESLKELAYTPVWLLDFTVQPGGKVKQPLPKGWNAFAYLLNGTTIFSSDGVSRPIEQYHNVVFESNGDSIEASVEEGAEKPSRFILVAGLPLDQPIVQYGPFVVTSRDEVMQAMMDYQSHSNGFERANNWESEIGKSMYDARIVAERQIPGPIKGVRANCLGDTIISKRPGYEPSNTAHDTFFHTHSPFKIPVGEKIGVPLEVQLIEYAVPWRHRRLDGDTTIKYSLKFDARTLNPAQWQILTGSIMIIRKDFKPLHCAHVDALREYYLRESISAAQLFDLPGEPHDPGEDLTPLIDINHQASSQQLLARVSKDGFESFFAHFMKGGGTTKYGAVASLYEV